MVYGAVSWSFGNSFARIVVVLIKAHHLIQIIVGIIF